MKNKNNHYIQQAYQKFWKIGKKDKRVICINLNNIFDKSKNEWIEIKDVLNRISYEINNKGDSNPKYLRNTDSLFCTKIFIDDKWDDLFKKTEVEGFKGLKILLKEVESEENKDESFFKFPKNSGLVKNIIQYSLLTYIRSKCFLEYYNGEDVKTFNIIRNNYFLNNYEILKEFNYYVFRNDFNQNSFKNKSTLIFSDTNLIYKNMDKHIKKTMLNKMKEDNENINELEINWLFENFIIVIIHPNYLLFGIKDNVFIKNEVIDFFSNFIVNSNLSLDIYFYNFLLYGSNFVMQENKVENFLNKFHKFPLYIIQDKERIEKNYNAKIDLYKKISNQE